MDKRAVIAQLFMASLRSAVVTSGYLAIEDLAALALVNKEASTIAHQCIKTLHGGFRLLEMMDRFPRAATLNLTLFRISNAKSPWEVPAAVVQQVPDLSRVRNLAIQISNKRISRKSKKLPNGIVAVDDPLADIIIPGLAHAHLQSITLTFMGSLMPLPVVSSRCS